MRQGAECAMGGGVAVAADDRHAGKGEALFRSDDMDDTLADVLLGIIFDAEIMSVLGERLDLDAALLVLDAFVAVGRGRDVMVDDSERLFGRADLAAGHAQAFESLRRRHLVNQVTVDVEKTGAVFVLRDDVVVPDLVVEGARCAHGCHSVREQFSEKGGVVAAKACAAARVAFKRPSAKSAVESAGYGCEEACRQTLVVLQHDKFVREASEFRSHGRSITSFLEGRQLLRLGAHGTSDRQLKLFFCVLICVRRR